jgi:hypothetical protein
VPAALPAESASAPSSNPPKGWDTKEAKGRPAGRTVGAVVTMEFFKRLGKAPRDG